MLLQGMLWTDEKDRLSLEEIKNHPYFTDVVEENKWRVELEWLRASSWSNRFDKNGIFHLSKHEPLVTP